MSRNFDCRVDLERLEFLGAVFDCRVSIGIAHSGLGLSLGGNIVAIVALSLMTAQVSPSIIIARIFMSLVVANRHSSAG